jgi:hypothetical protein
MAFKAKGITLLVKARFETAKRSLPRDARSAQVPMMSRVILARPHAR